MDGGSQRRGQGAQGVMAAPDAPPCLPARTRRPVPCTKLGCGKTAYHETHDVLEIETAHGHVVVVSLHDCAARCGLRLVPIDGGVPSGV